MKKFILLSILFLGASAALAGDKEQKVYIEGGGKEIVFEASSAEKAVADIADKCSEKFRALPDFEKRCFGFKKDLTEQKIMWLVNTINFLNQKRKEYIKQLYKDKDVSTKEMGHIKQLRLETMGYFNELDKYRTHHNPKYRDLYLKHFPEVGVEEYGLYYPESGIVENIRFSNDCESCVASNEEYKTKVRNESLEDMFRA